MSFPPVERVQYRKNPLKEVICQMRFPGILRIDNELPVAFQERVRKDYPFFEQKDASSPVVEMAGMPEDMRRIVADLVPKRSARTAYDFRSADGNWTVGLTRDFLALSTHAYATWEDFRYHLGTPLDALRDLYSPQFYTRIGLRYVNVIVRSELSLSEEPWSTLLQPHTIADLASQDVEGEVTQLTCESVIALGEDNAVVHMRRGLATGPQSPEISFLIDSDFYTEQRVETSDAYRVLADFNRRAGHLFRWCILPGLHEAMEPVQLS